MKTRKNKNVMRRLKKTKMKGGAKDTNDPFLKGDENINYSIQNQTVEINLSNGVQMNFDSRYLNFMDDNTKIDFNWQVGGPSKIINDTSHGKTFALGKGVIFNQSMGFMEISQHDNKQKCSFNISAEGGGRQLYAIKCRELNSYKLWKTNNNNINYHQKYNEDKGSVPDISFYIQQSILVGNTPSVFSKFRFRNKNNNPEIAKIQEIKKIKESHEQGLIEKVKDDINDNDSKSSESVGGGGMFDGTKKGLWSALGVVSLGMSDIITGMINDASKFVYESLQDLMMHSLISTDPENDIVFIRVMGKVIKKKLKDKEVIYINPHTLNFWESTVTTKMVPPTGDNSYSAHLTEDKDDIEGGGDKWQNIKGFYLGVDAGFLLKVTGPGLVIINGRRFTKSQIESQVQSQLPFTVK